MCQRMPLYKYTILQPRICIRKGKLPVFFLVAVTGTAYTAPRASRRAAIRFPQVSIELINSPNVIPWTVLMAGLEVWKSHMNMKTGAQSYDWCALSNIPEPFIRTGCRCSVGGSMLRVHTTSERQCPLQPAEHLSKVSASSCTDVCCMRNSES
ncbi:hypothetical protein EDD17DRAFT_900910 [Pisolithus thermaeus]|nr:hypothetical protein EDD17DRAFT_900910 [Pisolithus thermaeus]